MAREIKERIRYKTNGRLSIFELIIKGQEKEVGKRVEIGSFSASKHRGIRNATWLLAR